MAIASDQIQNYNAFTNLFITPVWGADFVRDFLNVSLPSQLSQGNLGALSPDDNVYCIVTTENGRQSIQESGAFNRLSEHAVVHFIVYGDHAIHGVKDAYSLMHDMYNSSLSYVKAEINCFFLSADFFCSEGLFSRALAAMQAEKKVVFAPSLRVSQDTFARALLQSGTICASPDEAVALALAHEQRITAACVVNNSNGGIFSLPSHTLYRMSNGYVGRWNVMHPLVVRLPPNPPKISRTVDWNYGVLGVSNPEEIDVLWDSDEGVVLTTTPQDYTQTGSLIFGGTDTMRVKNLVNWLGYGWALNIHVLQMDGVVCLHSGPIDRDEYAKGISAVDGIWKPFRDVISKHGAKPDPDFRKFLNGPAVQAHSSWWIRLRSNPMGVMKAVARKAWLRFA